MCWSRTKRASSSFNWKLTCSRHDIAEILLSWRKTTITHWPHLILSIIELIIKWISWISTPIRHNYIFLCFLFVFGIMFDPRFILPNKSIQIFWINLQVNNKRVIGSFPYRHGNFHFAIYVFLALFILVFMYVCQLSFWYLRTIGNFHFGIYSFLATSILGFTHF